MTWWGNAVGSVILMDDQLYAANAVQDSFITISTNHIPNVDIYYENTFAGKTNDNGYLLLTKIPAYYAAKYSVDPFTLSENQRIEPMEQQVAVKAKNGYLLSFAIETITPTNLTLVDEQNTYLPLGSEVTINNEYTTYVGWDGFAYFDHISPNNQLVVNTPEQVQYQCIFSADSISGHEVKTATHTIVCYQEESR